jgi:hypothetical protein
MIAGILVFVGGMLTASTWSAIRSVDRVQRRRSDRHHAL